MSQLLGLVTQIHGNECAINVNYGIKVRTTKLFVADADPQTTLESPIDGVHGYYFYLLYFHYFMTQHVV